MWTAAARRAMLGARRIILEGTSAWQHFRVQPRPKRAHRRRCEMQIIVFYCAGIAIANSIAFSVWRNSWGRQGPPCPN